MAKKKKKKKVKKKKVFQLTWAFENFEEHESFYTKRMFGGMAAYCHGKMMLLLAEDAGGREYRGTTYDFDIWNGILLPTYYEHHEKLMDQFPSLIQHPVLKKWLYLPLDTDSFEDDVHEITLKIKRNNKLFGIFPKMD